MARCQECGRPLCTLCVYFRDGAIYCIDHASAAVLPGAGPTTSVAISGHCVEGPAARGSAGAPGPAPDPADALGPAPAPDPGGPAWARDRRLEPLPMSLRPGWTEEPLQARPSALAENLGIAGLILALVGLPFSICCGVGVVLGLPLAVVSGGLCIAALVLAQRARNPNSARWTGGIGLAISVLSLLGSLCYVAAFAGMSTSVFSVMATP